MQRHPRSASGNQGSIECLEARRLLSYSYDGATGLLTIMGGAAGDTISVHRDSGSGTVNAQYSDDRGSHSDAFYPWDRPVRQIRIYGYGGNDTVLLDGPLPRTSVWGGLGDDRIDASAITSDGSGNQSYWLVGNENNDTVTGSMFNDGLHGNAGNDSLTGGGGVDALFGWTGNDSLYGGAGNDWLYGDADQDALDGGADDDHLYGLDGNDALAGGTGNDTLNGGYGSDTMWGNDGNDFFEGSRDGSQDYMFGGAGADTIDSRDASDWWLEWWG